MDEKRGKNDPVFERFEKQWALVTAGTPEHFNGCTVGWGCMGTLWNRPVVTVFRIRPVFHPVNRPVIVFPAGFPFRKFHPQQFIHTDPEEPCQVRQVIYARITCPGLPAADRLRRNCQVIRKNLLGDSLFFPQFSDILSDPDTHSVFAPSSVV